jgi:putative hemin transport protein
MSAVLSTTDALRERYARHREANPTAWLRDAAQALDVSELELLLATREDAVTRLATHDIPALLAQLAAVGELRTMTRNEWAVIEQDGRYDDLRFFDRGVGQTIGSIDLRIFASRWAHACAVEDHTPRGVRRSVQCFDASGTSIHKVFVDDVAAFEALRDQWRLPADAPRPEVVPVVVTPDRPDAECDAATLQARWDALTDTHQFHGLLRELGLGRLQALRLAGPTRALPVSPDALRTALEQSAAQHEKLMIFVSNTGIVQIFIGTIRKVVLTDGWLNVLDPGFNLHVRQHAIAHSYVVTKPTVDGPVRSLECYAADGSLIVQLFGKRLEGEQTPVGWSAILETIANGTATGVHA